MSSVVNIDLPRLLILRNTCCAFLFEDSFSLKKLAQHCTQAGQSLMEFLQRSDGVARVCGQGQSTLTDSYLSTLPPKAPQDSCPPYLRPPTVCPPELLCYSWGLACVQPVCLAHPLLLIQACVLLLPCGRCGSWAGGSSATVGSGPWVWIGVTASSPGSSVVSVARMNRPAPPVEVCYKNMRFLITHNPTNATLGTFIEDLKKYDVTTVVRVCEVTYDKTPLERDGITVMDWAFDDGAPPPTKIVDDWLNLLKTRFSEEPGCCVAVHCVAGLGRAPVLVALALIESGMKYEEAVQFIRQKRRGAINSKQLTYLEKYRSKQRLRFKDPRNHKSKCCTM
ncbi:hypothetical protein UPYG_G00307650 [Umbra pygmaea]|uniref:Protein tyrosine phosphatase type IVA 3 n=1 Tax=Umbra pygmaea TaxID=75934 RepID=A0ABD0W395_UMBPY